MYDPIKCYLSGMQSVEDVHSLLVNSKARKLSKKDFSVYYWAKYKDALIEVNGSSETIDYMSGLLESEEPIIDSSMPKMYFNVSIQVSLPKYYYGHNLKVLTLEDTKEAIDRLDEELGFNVSNMRVSRLDFAYNFNMNEPPVFYFQYLGEDSYLNRIPYNSTSNSLYYNSEGRNTTTTKNNKTIPSNSKKVCVFYDKIKEFEKKEGENGMPLPKEYQGVNLLRYELRLSQNILSQLSARCKELGWDKDPLEVKDLYNPQFFKVVLSEYIRLFNRIKPIKLINLTKDVKRDLDTMGKAYDAFICSLLQENKERITPFIEELRGLKTMNDSSYYSKLRSKFNEAINKLEPPKNKGNLYDELHSRINSLGELLKD